jgi:predicted type IV restriction endonuclease
MPSLNLPSFDTKIKKQNGKDYIFDRLRKSYVRLTPEEFVRQHFIHYLIEHKSFPASLLANEISITLANVRKRCDTIVYDKYLKPLVIIEYKSPSVTISQQTFDQIARYNIALQVPWLIVSNGLQHFCCRIDYENNSYRFEKEIPQYETLNP